MDQRLLRDHYELSGFTLEQGRQAVDAVEDYLRFCESHECVPPWSIDSVRAYLAHRIDQGRDSEDVVLALARYAYLTGKTEAYTYFTSIVGIESIVRNLADRVESVAGPEKRDVIFDPVNVPPAGSPPEAMPPLTRGIVRRMSAELNDEDLRTALTGNMHGIPASTFAGERERFLAAKSLDEYLADYHRRNIEILQKHCDEGTPWFEQRITQEVVDLVRSEPEVLGGVRDGRRIFTTKIPYKPDEWTRETDPDRRRYLACHCPMAREALKPGAKPSDRGVPPVWCHCSAGFARLMFEVVFDSEVEVEIIETVMDGAQRCRFAITIPPHITL